RQNLGRNTLTQGQRVLRRVHQSGPWGEAKMDRLSVICHTCETLDQYVQSAKGSGLQDLAQGRVWGISPVIGIFIAQRNMLPPSSLKRGPFNRRKALQPFDQGHATTTRRLVGITNHSELQDPPLALVSSTERLHQTFTLGIFNIA